MPDTCPPHYRARLSQLEAENLRLRACIDATRVYLADAQVSAQSARSHAIRQAATIAANFGAYGAEKQFPSVVGIDISMEILKMEKPR